MAKVGWRALFVLLFVGRAAHAGPNEQRLAQALFDDARRLMDQKRYSEACPKLAESQRLDPGGGTLLNLAVCHAAEGKTATALVEYNDALSVATRDGRHDREEIARAAIAKLEAEVPRITVVVPTTHRASGLEVKIDETPLPSVAWDVPMPIDPGTHSVVASVPGRAPWTAIVSVLPSEKKTIEIPMLAPHAEPPAAVPPAVMTPAPIPHTTSSRKSTNPLYVGAIGLTIVAGGAMIVTGVLALGEQSKAEDNCLADRNWCRNQDGRDAADNAKTLALVSTAALVFAGVGVIGMLVVPSKRPAAKASGSTFLFETTF